MLHLIYTLFFLTATLSVPTSEKVASPDRFGVDDIRPTVHELLSGRIDKKKISPLVLQKTIQNFIDRADPDKVYFLDSEVQTFSSKAFSARAFQEYQNGRFDFFLKLLTKTQEVIERARMVPTSVQGSKNGQKYDSFAQTAQELQERQQVSVRSQEREHDFLLVDCRNQNEREELFARLFLRAFASTLDAHSTIFTPKEAERLRSDLNKRVEGIGVVVVANENGFFIDSILKGSPADKSSAFFPRDELVAINGQSVSELSREQVQAQLEAGCGSKIGLTLKRPSSSSGRIQVQLVSEQFDVQEGRVKVVTYPVQGGVLAYVFIPSFYGGEGQVSCADDVRNALLAATKNFNVLGVVLDMRLNRGGYLEEAVKVAGLFITTGVVVRVKYFDGTIKTFRDIDPSRIYAGPLVVLTSKATASAAEIVTEALREYGVGLIVGDDTTYGKGTVQYETASKNAHRKGGKGDEGLKVTIGLYYSPSGVSTQLRGVPSDIVIPSPWSHAQIGEQYLKGVVPGDVIAPFWSDQLEGVPPQNLSWYEQNYLPFIQRPVPLSANMIEKLQKESLLRIAKNKQYVQLIQQVKKTPTDLAFQQQLALLELQEALAILVDYAKYKE